MVLLYLPDFHLLPGKARQGKATLFPSASLSLRLGHPRQRWFLARNPSNLQAKQRSNSSGSWWSRGLRTKLVALHGIIPDRQPGLQGFTVWATLSSSHVKRKNSCSSGFSWILLHPRGPKPQLHLPGQTWPRDGSFCREEGKSGLSQVLSRPPLRAMTRS